MRMKLHKSWMALSTRPLEFEPPTLELPTAAPYPDWALAVCLWKSVSEDSWSQVCTPDVLYVLQDLVNHPILGSSFGLARVCLHAPAERVDHHEDGHGNLCGVRILLILPPAIHKIHEVRVVQGDFDHR